jgi:hypothetical protein
MISFLPYHEKTVQYFKRQLKAWQFFSAAQQKEDQVKDLRNELLKNTYRFDQSSEPGLYNKIVIAKNKLGLTIPVAAYQAQHAEELNATVAFIEGQAHIVFSGNLIELLDEEELLAVIGHELAHVQLYAQLNGDLEIADRIINAVVNNLASTPAHYETARLFNLYTEIFCDRGAYMVTENYKPVISSLVKIATGLKTVNADSYIKQAEEIFSSDAETKTAGISHPENFIRARAIGLWHLKGIEANKEITQIIEGNAGIDEFDLFRQEQITHITHQIIEKIVRPEWMQTASTMALAQQFDTEIPTAEKVSSTDGLNLQIEGLHQSAKDYLSYVLYDFTAVDGTLEDIPLGYCFQLADEFHIGAAFSNTVKKERKLTDKKVSSLKKQSLVSLQSHQTNSL